MKSSLFVPLLLVAAGMSASVAGELSASSGEQLYQRFCASCHGKNGEGDGPIAPYFKLLPPDLTQIARRSGGSFPAERVRRIIDGRQNLLPHGARKMPVWGQEFESIPTQPATDRAAVETSLTLLVEHLRSIQGK